MQSLSAFSSWRYFSLTPSPYFVSHYWLAPQSPLRYVFTTVQSIKHRISSTRSLTSLCVNTWIFSDGRLSPKATPPFSDNSLTKVSLSPTLSCTSRSASEASQNKFNSSTWQSFSYVKVESSPSKFFSCVMYIFHSLNYTLYDVVLAHTSLNILLFVKVIFKIWHPELNTIHQMWAIYEVGRVIFPCDRTNDY